MDTSNDLRKLQVQGLHHVTITGADRHSAVAFWEGVLGMPLVFEQRNPRQPDQCQLFFDPGDDRFLTVFTDETRVAGAARPDRVPGAVHHLAFTVSRAVFDRIAARLSARGVAHSRPKHRGFMESLYLEDPMGLLVELACYTFAPPAGCRHADVLREAYRIQMARGDATIRDTHLADAIERLVARMQPSLSPDRGPQNPY